MSNMVTGTVEGGLTYKDARRLADCFLDAVNNVYNQNVENLKWNGAIVDYDVPFASEEGSNSLPDINQENYWDDVPYVVKAVSRINNRDDSWGDRFIDLKSGPERSSPTKVFQMEAEVLMGLNKIVARRHQRGNNVWSNQPRFVLNS